LRNRLYNFRSTPISPAPCTDSAGVIAANAEFIKEIGGNLISRALNIQPTLTIENGEKIAIMLNKNIYLPPVNGFQTTQRYILP
jgi:type IV secretory pathway VirB10-like protein